MGNSRRRETFLACLLRDAHGLIDAQPEFSLMTGHAVGSQYEEKKEKGVDKCVCVARE
jgi:hypothetical protein